MSQWMKKVDKKIPPGVLPTVLSPTQGPGTAGASPEGATKSIRRLQYQLMRGQAEKSGAVQPGEGDMETP